MTNYSRGANFERAICAHLSTCGAFCVRAAGSHGIADVIAVWPTGPTWLIQAKTNGKMSGADALHPNVTLVSVEEIKRKYDMFGAIMEIIRGLPAGQVITESDLKQSVDHPDPYRFKKTMDAHEKELEPYRIMLKYRGSEAKYHYGKPEVVADLKATLERP